MWNLKKDSRLERLKFCLIPTTATRTPGSRKCLPQVPAISGGLNPHPRSPDSRCSDFSSILCCPKVSSQATKAPPMIFCAAGMTLGPQAKEEMGCFS